LLYRAVAWLALDREIAPIDVAALVPLAAQITLVADSRGRMGQVLAAGQDVTAQIADPAVDRAVSDYSKVPELRAALMPRQRSLAAEGGIIMAGRDIGTVILPHADIKLYINASAEARAGRRATQRGATDGADAERILHDLRRRDSIDSSRETAPLRVAPDATVIDTDSIGFEETVCAVVETIRLAQGGSSGR
jgi:cytidylate kinase